MNTKQLPIDPIDLIDFYNKYNKCTELTSREDIYVLCENSVKCKCGNNINLITKSHTLCNKCSRYIQNNLMIDFVKDINSRKFNVTHTIDIIDTHPKMDVSVLYYADIKLLDNVVYFLINTCIQYDPNAYDDEEDSDDEYCNSNDWYFVRYIVCENSQQREKIVNEIQTSGATEFYNSHQSELYDNDFY